MDDVADRLREIELTMAGVVQRVADHENDYRVFAPLVTEQALMRRALEELEKDLTGAHGAIREIASKLEREREERIAGQQQRKRELEEAVAARTAEIAKIEEHRELESQKNRTERLRITLALLAVFITSAGGVVVAIVTSKGG